MIRLVARLDGQIGVLDVFIDGAEPALPRELRSLMLPPSLDLTNGVVVVGRIPRWLALYLFAACAEAPWCGSFVPGLGVVVVDVDPARSNYRRGQVLTTMLQRESDSLPAAAIVAVGGPPHSGKSVFFRVLQQTLQRECTQEEQRRMSFVRLCPDGEGNWAFEVSSDTRQRIRDKRPWDEQFVEHVCRTLVGLRSSVQLVVADLGGRIDDRNRKILRHCTHGIIVSADPAATAQWRTAFDEAGLQLIAEAESVLTGQSTMLCEWPLQLRLCGLDRDRVADVVLPAVLIKRVQELVTIS